jgi:hypothetical protein
VATWSCRATRSSEQICVDYPKATWSEGDALASCEANTDYIESWGEANCTVDNFDTTRRCVATRDIETVPTFVVYSEFMPLSYCVDFLDGVMEERPGNGCWTDYDDDGEVCATVTGTISIEEGFAAPATAIMVGLYIVEPDPGAPALPDVMGDLIDSPAIDSDTDYALNQEICGMVSGSNYYTAVAVYAGSPGQPGSGDAIGVTDSTDTYTDGYNKDLGDMALEIIP